MRTLSGILILLFAFTGNPVHSQTGTFMKEQISGCAGTLRQAILGTMGNGGLVVADVDNDGQAEMLCSGDEGPYLGSEQFWYVLAFNSATAAYEPVYVSGMYGEDYISALAVFDVDSDGETEILIGKDNGEIDIFDGTTKQHEYTIPAIQIPGSFSRIYRLLLADADNDGRNELLAGSFDNTWLYEYNNGNYSLAMTFPYSGQDIACGNVDADPLLETIFASGEVLRIHNNTSEYLWRIPTHDTFSCVELADTDGDGIQEILYDGWYLGVYDGDTQQIKYEVYTGSQPNTFLMYDVNGDGIAEIMYANSDGVTCLNSSNGEEYWAMPDSDYSISALATGDSDGDGDVEICWTSSDFGNFINVFDISTQVREWRSLDARGPFTSVRIADADDDGQPELLTLTYESEAGYGSGILTVFDATSGAQEWQCNSDFFSTSFNGINDLEITDIDNDGETEIIVSGSYAYYGKIWVIDGKTHTIESTHSSSAFNYGFYAFAIGDPDNDGQREFIASTRTTVFIINPVTLETEWSSPVFEGLAKPVQKLICTNIDNDSEQEIIFLNGSISIIDGSTHIIHTFSETGFSSFELFDMNNDGLVDIVAGTVTGQIGVYRAPGFEFSWLPIQMDGRINDLHIAEIHGDARPDLVFISGGVVWFSTPEGEMQGSARLGDYDALYDCLEISDYNNDGEAEVFAGTSYRVTELGTQCYQCMSIAVETTGTDISCEITDGIATAIATGGVEPYIFQWSNGETGFMQQNLAAGTYEVIITDQLGCTRSDEITLEQSVLTAIIAATLVGCNTEFPAKVSTEIKKGHPPYTWEWTTGENEPQFETFQPGTYTVMIHDVMNCSRQLSVDVHKDTLILETSKQKIICDRPGSIESDVLGLPPFHYDWSNGYHTPDITCPEPGDFTLTVTDSLGCTGTATVTIDPWIPVGGEFRVEPDNYDTVEPDGLIAFKPAGGDPPYRIYWHNIWAGQNDTLLTNVPAGEYSLTIMDSNDCSADLTVEVESTSPNKPCRIFPVPALNELHIDLGMNYNPAANVTADVITIHGQRCFTSVLTKATNRIRIDHLKAGLYLLMLNIDGEFKVLRFEKVTPKAF